MYRVVWELEVATSPGWSADDVAGAAFEATSKGAPSVIADLEPESILLPDLLASAETFALESADTSPAAGPLDPLVRRLARHQQAFCESLEEAEELATRLRESSRVRAVDIRGRPRTGPFDPAAVAADAQGLAAFAFAPLVDLSPRQRYLESSPVGFGVLAAQGLPGVDGAAAHVVDIEWGWNASHRDSPDRFDVVRNGGTPEDVDHGTAAVGVLAAPDDGLGVRGIVPAAQVTAISVETAPGKWSEEDALLRAISVLRGQVGVLLVELQTGGNFPLEYLPGVRLCIERAIAEGIHVVVAAGNGGADLDAPFFHGSLSRGSDSGAIWVGSARSWFDPPPRRRRDHSNYGSRLDLQAWGDGIVTAGGDSRARWFDLHRGAGADDSYTQSFFGTSGASALVAGLVAGVASCLEVARQERILPATMRSLLSSTASPQEPVNDPRRIGPAPDLQAALAWLELT